MKAIPGSPEPLTEAELMSGWQGGPDAPVLSICCTTFNHADVIEDAFRGFLAQRTDFPFEVIIHDDASTDGTSDIVRRWAEAYPRIVRAVVQEVNQFSRTGRTLMYAFELARGGYVALCEGDDYWTSPDKLQRQVDALRQHEGVELCVHLAWRINVSNGRMRMLGRSARHTAVIPTEELIARRHGPIAMASMTMTRASLQRYFDYRRTHELTVGDIYIAMIASSPHGAVMLPEPMSVYRWRQPGSWTGVMAADPARRLAHARAQIRAHHEIESHLRHVPRTAFASARTAYASSAVLAEGLPRRERAVRLLTLGRYLGGRDVARTLRELVGSRPR